MKKLMCHLTFGAKLSNLQMDKIEKEVKKRLIAEGMEDTAKNMVRIKETRLRG